jgi:hypothetical protein
VIKLSPSTRSRIGWRRQLLVILQRLDDSILSIQTYGGKKAILIGQKCVSGEMVKEFFPAFWVTRIFQNDEIRHLLVVVLMCDFR